MYLPLPTEVRRIDIQRLPKRLLFRLQPDEQVQRRGAATVTTQSA
jgi:hypothetical protein